MSTAHEIEAAIRMLSPAEREKLIKDLPIVLSELNGDIAWNQTIGDGRTRPGLTALLDQVEPDHQKKTAAFPEIKEEFDRRFPA
jgi:2-oxo-4-hydroxy-4-carboxy--5-ureidoimidazoline (OHCU) decarboxylase